MPTRRTFLRRAFAAAAAFLLPWRRPPRAAASDSTPATVPDPILLLYGADWADHLRYFEDEPPPIRPSRSMRIAMRNLRARIDEIRAEQSSPHRIA